MRIFSKKAKQSRLHFALELIVGLVLFALIVIALLFVFSRGGYRSPRAACISRLKQLTTATLMYADDNNDCYPPYYTFDGPEATQKLIDVTLVYSKNKDIYLCPQDNDTIQPGQEGLEGKMTYVDSLTLRGIIPEFSTGKRVLRQSDVKDVAMTPFLRDPIRGYGLAEPKSKEQKPQFMSPHGARFILSYLDGHAKAKSPIDEFKEL
jgi:hypothetical protein